MITASSSPGILTTGLIGDVGLILDITAAFFLAMSFVLKKQAEMFRETSDYWNGNPFRLPSAVRQSLEARVGFMFLALGFLGQFIAYSSWFNSGSDRYPGTEMTRRYEFRRGWSPLRPRGPGAQLPE
jgi:hypothetical protein